MDETDKVPARVGLLRGRGDSEQLNRQGNESNT